MSCFKTVLSVELTELAAVIEFMHLSLAGGLLIQGSSENVEKCHFASHASQACRYVVSHCI